MKCMKTKWKVTLYVLAHKHTIYISFSFFVNKILKSRTFFWNLVESEVIVDKLPMQSSQLEMVLELLWSWGPSFALQLEICVYSVCQTWCTELNTFRNVLGWEDANSQEMYPDGTNHVIIEMPEHNPGQLGGTMRLGKRQTLFKTQDSKLRQLYGNVDFVEERHRHRFVISFL